MRFGRRNEAEAAPQRIEGVKRILERAWKAIENQTSYPMPSAMQCATCPYRAVPVVDRLMGGDKPTCLMLAAR